jgi:prepilin-type N-terminal cleavage/methylation domain-containing protein
MNKKGFTLVELLAVLVILSLLMVIAVPASINVSKKVKAKMYNNKVSLIKDAALLWAQDNKACLQKNTGTSDSACANVTCTQEGNIKSCKLTVGDLAAAGYLDYDNATTVTNPQTGDSMNAETIEIKYNKANNSISIGEYK